MNKLSQYSEEQLRKAKEKSERMVQMFVNGLKKAKKLGIADMTKSEAEEYLKKKEEESREIN